MATVPEWVTLTEGETVVWTGGPSPVQVLKELTGEGLLVVVGLAVAALRPTEVAGVPIPGLELLPVGLGLVGLGLVLVGVLAGLATYLRFRAVEYVVTSEELYVKRGLVSRSVTNLRLDRVQDCGFEQSATQRLSGYGDVYVSTAGGGGVELVFRNVPDPAAVNGVVTERLAEIREG